MAFRENADAVNLALSLSWCSHVWDDLVDQDRVVEESTINSAFYTILVGLPSNPFYRKHMDTLLPIMALGAMNYEIANTYQRSGHRENIALAHVLRYSIADLATAIALIIGGPDWVRQIGPELRQRCQKDTLDNYLSEHLKSNGSLYDAEER